MLFIVPDQFILIAIGFILLVLVAAYFGKKAREARINALNQFASSRGFQFHPGIMSSRISGGFLEQVFGDRNGSDEGRFLARFQGFAPFGGGHSEEVNDLIYGKVNDLDIAAFDYSYKTTSSDGKTTQTQTHPFGVVVVRIPVLLPVITLVPENFMHRLGTKFGVKEITFEVEEFNRKYFIQSSDDRQAYDLFHPKMIEFMLSCQSRHWQIAGYQILLYTSGRYETAEIGAAIDEIIQFASLIPGYVRSDHGFNANWQGPF